MIKHAETDASEIQLIGPTGEEQWAMEVVPLQSAYRFRFSRYNKHQRKLIELEGTTSFTTGSLGSSQYEYQYINHRDVNIKWLSNNGNLYQRTISYDVDLKSVTIGEAEILEFSDEKMKGIKFTHFT